MHGAQATEQSRWWQIRRACGQIPGPVVRILREMGGQERLLSKVVPSPYLRFNSMTQAGLLRPDYMRSKVRGPGKRPLQ